MIFTNRRSFKLAAACLTIASLVACGGGGGSDAPASGGSPAPGANQPTPAAQIAKDYLASIDKSLAVSVPATGEANTSTVDGCYLNGGRTKANAISSYNADLPAAIASNVYRIGSTRVNPVVKAERNTTNTDGSTRREIDVQYAINYTDGSADNVAQLTLITGSSFGSCATAQNSTDTRSFGDRQMVSVELRAETSRTNQFELRQTLRPVAAFTTSAYPTIISTNGNGTTGTFAVVPAGESKTIPTFYERQVNVRIQDPMANATYAVVTGPGFLTVSNVLTPWSIKMLSPRLLKADPLLAGKNGNYTSWNDDSSFQLCRLANGGSPGSAALADCAVGGARSTRWGISMNLPIALPNAVVSTADAAVNDARLAAVGIVAGTYTFAIYNDDGWKTINGQAGKTPIATYTAQLDSLPISFVDMNVTSNSANDKFPKISSPSTPAATAASEIAGLAYQGSLTWTAPLFVATDPFKVSFIEAYAEGSVSSTGVVYPRVAKFTDVYPASNATSGTINVAANPVNLAFKTYAEAQVNYTNRNGTRIRSIVSFN